MAWKLLTLGFVLKGAIANSIPDLPGDQYPIVDDVEAPGIQGVPGKIVLYSGSRLFPDDLDAIDGPKQACSDAGPSKTVDIAPGVCLSGDYYLRENLKVLETPKCADGSLATMSFYRNRRCTGTPQIEAASTEISATDCLWSKEKVSVPTYYWSLIFRCKSDPQASEIHQTATPPAMLQEFAGPLPGRVRFHNMPNFPCHSDFASKSHSRVFMPDGCDWPISSWPHQTIEIMTPAICPNGTRAQLQLYENFSPNWRDWRCYDNHRMTGFERLDIDDSMLQTCINIKHRTRPKRAVGAQFYCDGLEYINDKPVLPKQKPAQPPAGMVSHNVCPMSTGRWQWSEETETPTFMYPAAGTCVNLPARRQLRKYKGAECPDGSPARFARWAGAGCGGWPQTIDMVDSRLFLNCDHWNLQQETSYMFWCGSNGTAAEETREDSRAVVTRNGCPKEPRKDGWISISSGPSYERIESDVCLRVQKDARWNIFSTGRCADGRAAKIALWQRPGCRGSVSSLTELDQSPIAKCLPACEDGKCESMAFWCEGLKK